MSAQDNKGRAWTRLSEIKIGDKVVVDANLSCIPAHRNRPRTVWGDAIGLFIRCNDGRHYLFGQLTKRTDHLIGVYKVEAK